MRLSKLFTRGKQMRGKSKSPEAKFKEKQAQVNSFLLDSWLKRLKEDPTLADRISEQRYGSEGIPRYDGEGYEGAPDLLEVLRQAAEAKKLLKSELGEGRGSWLSDLAEIMRSLPQVLAALPQIKQAVAQQQIQGRTHATVERKTIAEQQLEAAKQAQLDNKETLTMSLETLVPLVELSPEEAWTKLVADGEQGWTWYLSHTPSEDIMQQFDKLAELATNDEQKEEIRNFIKQKHDWISELVSIAHNSLANDSKIAEI